MIRDAQFRLPEFDLPFKLGEHEDQINALLRTVGSVRYFFLWDKGEHKAMILGTIHPLQYHGTTDRFSQKPLIIFDTEIMRSPAWLLSNAGTNYKKAYVVRDQSVLTIWYNKWTSFFSSNESYAVGATADSCREYAMREGIKVKAFNAYGIHTGEDLAMHEADFLHDSCQGIVWHEYGHCISGDNGVFLPQPEAHLCRNLSTLDMDAFYPYAEVMADYAPAMQGVHGPALLYLPGRQDRSSTGNWTNIWIH